jgi:hypothetical protein
MIVGAALGVEPAFAQMPQALQDQINAPQRDPKIPSTIQPLPASDLPSDSFLHDFRVGLDRSYDRTGSKLSNQRLLRTTRTTSLNGDMKLGEIGFAGMSLGWFEESTQAANGTVPGSEQTDADLHGRRLLLTGGVYVLPFWTIGAATGWNESHGDFMFASGTKVPTNTDGKTHSLFTTLYYPPSPDWLLSLTAAGIKSYTDQDYGGGNSPAEQQSWAKIGSLTLRSDYALSADWGIMGSVGVNKVSNQKSFQNEPGLDEKWGTLGAGVLYKVTENLNVNLSAATWINNSTHDYRRLSLGAGYKF